MKPFDSCNTTEKLSRLLDQPKPIAASIDLVFPLVQPACDIISNNHGPLPREVINKLKRKMKPATKERLSTTKRTCRSTKNDITDVGSKHPLMESETERFDRPNGGKKDGVYIGLDDDIDIVLDSMAQLIQSDEIFDPEICEIVFHLPT